MDTFLLTSDVARILGITPDGVRMLERSGKLRSSARVGSSKTRLFAQGEVHRLFVAREAARLKAAGAKGRWA